MITLATLPNATAQEVFDQVAAHLLQQNKKSGQADGSCMYRYGELKCAAGCLIGDDEYREEYEGVQWAFLVQDGTVPSAHEDLIDALQGVHDSYDPSAWRKHLRRVAHENNLKWNLAYDSEISP